MRKIILLLSVLFPLPCFAESVVVELSTVPADGFVVCPLDMTPAANWLSVPRMDGTEFFYGDQKLDAAFVPGSGESPLRGTFVAVLPDDLPKGKPVRLRIEHRDAVPPNRTESPIVAGSLTFDAAKHGGLPSIIESMNMESMKWFDRLHDPETGSWNVANEKIELVVDKPFVKVLRTSVVFKQGNDAPPSQPKAEYQWFVFPHRELVYATVLAMQNEPTEWKEKHFFELHHPTGTKWFGDDKSGTFTTSRQSQTFSRYAGFIVIPAQAGIQTEDVNPASLDPRLRGGDGEGGEESIIAVISPGTVLYDGLNEFGPYLMPKGSNAWQAWTDTRHHATAWYWIGTSKEPAKTLQSAYESVTKMPHAEIVIPELEAATDWKIAALNDLFLSGKITSKEELERLQKVELPENWSEGWMGWQVGWLPLGPCDCGYDNDLAIILDVSDDDEKGKGLRLLSLVDKRTNTILSARESVPLFTAEVLDKETGKMYTLTSDDGWKDGYMRGKSEFYLSNPKVLPKAKKLEICFSFSHFGWGWSVSQEVDRYEFRKASVGQIALRNLGPTMKAFYPHASGVVTENPIGKELHWRGTYPSGWCSMQYTATYDETKNVGLYVDSADYGGSVKDIRLDADPVSDTLVIRFEQPLPLGQWQSSAVAWRTFQGNWYDAVTIYREENRNNTEWNPYLGPDGRIDTPQWMKELSVWALCSDPPQKMPETMRKFTDALGIPTAVHWYNWHQIPFDNDYPHYFPAKDGFKEAVAEIQKNGDCFVMPYINGRLWDTRDKGAEDFQFTSVALPGATKKEDGSVYIETYGSKESDGSPVELAAMCPASEVWKNKVTENIFRLVNEYGVAGVYVDQVAAAQPCLCFDKSHDHPLAGGDWWNRAYWRMFEKIRSELPKDRMLTTECNAEPFVNIFDGYLTWHFQYQDQVPAFAAVYGGTVQMFGRAYRGGPSQVLADRMKLAQQLVYGEQIGWIDPRIVDDAVRFPFFKAIVQTRHKYRDYFYKGEMIRPPKLLDDIPTVTADWQWSGETIITTDAVLTGGWRKKDADGNTISAVFFFVNVSDKPITSRVKVDTDLPTDAFDEALTFEPGVPMVVEVKR